MLLLEDFQLQLPPLLPLPLLLQLLNLWPLLLL
jgi:hypothetical protein